MLLKAYLGFIYLITMLWICAINKTNVIAFVLILYVFQLKQAAATCKQSMNGPNIVVILI